MSTILKRGAPHPGSFAESVDSSLCSQGCHTYFHTQGHCHDLMRGDVAIYGANSFQVTLRWFEVWGGSSIEGRQDRHYNGNGNTSGTLYTRSFSYRLFLISSS